MSENRRITPATADSRGRDGRVNGTHVCAGGKKWSQMYLSLYEGRKRMDDLQPAAGLGGDSAVGDRKRSECGERSRQVQ